MARNNSAEAQVAADIERAEEALLEAMARLARLRKQRRLLKERGDSLVSRGVRDLDEADGVRSQEDAILAEQQAVGSAQALGAFGVIDWSAMDLESLLDGAPSAGAAS